MEYIEFLGLRAVPTFSCSQLCNKEPQYLATQDYHMLIEQLGEVRENVVNSASYSARKQDIEMKELVGHGPIRPLLNLHLMKGKNMLLEYCNGVRWTSNTAWDLRLLSALTLFSLSPYVYYSPSTAHC
jgi:hypothetical protein